MKIFELQTKMTSYTYSIVKIVVCLAILLFGISRNSFIHISDPSVERILSAIFFVLGSLTVLCLIISIGELFHTHSNRKSQRKINIESIKAKLMTIEAIRDMVSQNDIIEIEGYIGDKIIKFGASSDCERSSFIFKDKLYYIMDSEYDTIDLFMEALVELFPDRNILVFKIDGLSPD